jgi:SAM-dependent methyltransferase
MSPLQKDRFLAGEGDAWFRRNRDAIAGLGRDCPVLKLITNVDPYPARVLEIGCANGWRLNEILQAGAQECVGLDPSRAAIEHGRRAFPALRLEVGTADRLPRTVQNYDLIIFGFCLYLCDPADHFEIVAQADRALADGGHLIIYDFDAASPYRNEYAHAPGMFSYKTDYARFFMAHPHYRLRDRRSFAHSAGEPATADNRVAISLLAKDMRSAWPPNPWRNDRS